MTEKELLRLFQLRDERALSTAEVQYGKLCRTMAYRILGDRQDAEECANDVKHSRISSRLRIHLSA